MKAVLRIFTGLVFIISGLVKVVDPVGFSFKLEEYFDVFRLSQFAPIALAMAVGISSVEVLLGMMLALRIRLKITLLALLLLCSFFAFLTFYSAYFNVVTDCGCFGDALKLRPWQSFFKDILLFAALVSLWVFYAGNFVFNGNQKLKKIVLLSATVLLVFLAYMGIRHEPVIDFRDYKIGTNLLTEKQKIVKNPSAYRTVYVLKNKKSGDEKRLNQDEYLSDKALWQRGSPWGIETDKTSAEMYKQGYSSEISKFNISSKNGEDLTSKILASPKAALLFCYNPKNADPEIISKAEIKILNSAFDLKIGVAPSFSPFRKLPAATMDATAIKTIARSNPFVLILRHGKIVVKKSARDFLND